MNPKNDMCGKIDLSDEYRAPLPDRYFRRLDKLQYRAPDSVAHYVDDAIAYFDARGIQPTILDVGASFGFTTMRLRTGMSFAELATHFTSRPSTVAMDEAISADRLLFRPKPTDPPTVGLDLSEPALQYARAVGLHAESLVADATGDIGSQLRTLPQAPVLVVATGILGYLDAESYSRLLRGLSPRPYVSVAVVARTLNTDLYVDEISRIHNSRVRKMATPERQRRFASTHERDSAAEAARRWHPDEPSLELDGWVYAYPLLATDFECAEWITAAGNGG